MNDLIPPVPMASDDALCAGHARMFDGETVRDIQLAVKLCNVCKALPECRDWTKKAARGSLHGVAAGQLWGSAVQVYHRGRKW